MRLIPGVLDRLQRGGSLPGVSVYYRRAQPNLAHLQSRNFLERGADALFTRRRMHSLDGDGHPYLNNERSIASAIAL
jgi:hypothetical protein